MHVLHKEVKIRFNPGLTSIALTISSSKFMMSLA